MRIFLRIVFGLVIGLFLVSCIFGLLGSILGLTFGIIGTVFGIVWRIIFSPIGLILAIAFFICRPWRGIPPV